MKPRASNIMLEILRDHPGINIPNIEVMLREKYNMNVERNTIVVNLYFMRKKKKVKSVKTKCQCCLRKMAVFALV